MHNYCIYTYICIYIYIHIYIYIYTCIYIYLSLSANTHTTLIHGRRLIYKHINTCITIVYIHTYVYIYISIYIYLSLSTNGQLFTAEGWNDNLYDVVGSTDVWNGLFFFALIVCGNWILSSLFVGILITNMNQKRDAAFRDNLLQMSERLLAQVCVGCQKVVCNVLRVV